MKIASRFDIHVRSWMDALLLLRDSVSSPKTLQREPEGEHSVMNSAVPYLRGLLLPLCKQQCQCLSLETGSHELSTLIDLELHILEFL